MKYKVKKFHQVAIQSALNKIKICTTDQQQSSKSEKKKTFKQYARKPEEVKTGMIPMLKYGKGNNFYKFKAALLEAALREYGNLGKLIKQEKCYVPVLL